jgi:hypothetical protein
MILKICLFIFYDNTKYSISVVKLKDSDLDTYKKSVFCVKCFNYYYVGRPKFKVNIKSVT